MLSEDQTNTLSQPVNPLSFSRSKLQQVPETIARPRMSNQNHSQERESARLSVNMQSAHLQSIASKSGFSKEKFSNKGIPTPRQQMKFE